MDRFRVIDALRTVAYLLLGGALLVAGAVIVADQIVTVRPGPLAAGLLLAATGLVVLDLPLARLIRRPARRRLDRYYSYIEEAPLYSERRIRRPVPSLVIAAAGLLALAVAWLLHDHAALAAIAGGVAVLATAAAAFLLIADTPSWVPVVAGLVAVAVAATMSAVAASTGHVTVAWIFGIVAALPVAVPALWLVVWALSAGRTSDAVPLTAQLAGLVVPLGSLATAAVIDAGADVRGSVDVLIGAAGILTVAAATALVLQSLLLIWLSAERTLLWERDFRDRLGLPWPPGEPTPESVFDQAFTPSTPPRVRAAVHRTRVAHAVHLDDSWTGCDLTLPADLRRSFRHAARSVAALRVATASAILTALCWGALAFGLFGPAAAPAVIAGAILGPLFLAAVLLANLRTRTALLYERRAAAITLNRDSFPSTSPRPGGAAGALPGFSGLLSIEVRGGHADPEAVSVFNAAAGSRMSLTLLLTADEDTLTTLPDRRSPILEPVVIGNGRASGPVEFEVLADSPTLRPAPHRAALTGNQRHPAEALFSVPIPAEPGDHDLWFQLYQGGQLVQAIALRVRARK